jgi:hypothetical protein
VGDYLYKVDKAGIHILPKHCKIISHSYYGYLASGYHDHAAASSFVCVDVNPEYLNSGVGDQNGKLFYRR